jgi:predicted nucleic acid-binding protein
VAFPRRVFCDTSFFYACLDPKDENHEQAGELVTEAVASRTAFWTTWDIIGETVTLLRYRAGFAAALTFLDEVKPTLRIVTYGDRVRVEAEDVFRRFGRDHRLSLCDAVSFVVITGLLRNIVSLAFDGDFRALGLPVIPPNRS